MGAFILRLMQSSRCTGLHCVATEEDNHEWLHESGIVQQLLILSQQDRQLLIIRGQVASERETSPKEHRTAHKCQRFIFTTCAPSYYDLV